MRCPARVWKFKSPFSQVKMASKNPSTVLKPTTETIQCRFGLRKNRFKKMGSHSQTDRSVVRTNFCVPLEPRAAGGGSSGTHKLIKQNILMRVFCPHGPLRKYFRSVFSACTDHYENIFEARTSQKPRENLAKTWRKPPKKRKKTRVSLPSGAVLKQHPHCTSCLEKCARCTWT